MTAPTVTVVTLAPDELSAIVEGAVRRALDARRDTATAAPRLLSKQELAAVLSISTVTLDRQIAAGRIPWTRVGDCKRFDLDAVRAALDTAAQAPATTEPKPVQPASTLAGVTRISPRRAG